MRTPQYSRQFKKDSRIAQKRGKDMGKLKSVLALLLEGHPLPERLKDHPLTGVFAGYRECHIEPDWLLIYKLDPSAIYFTRTGTHSDLFGS